MTLTQNRWAHGEPAEVELPVEAAPVKRERLDVGEVVVVDDVDHRTNHSLPVLGNSAYRKSNNSFNLSLIKVITRFKRFCNPLKRFVTTQL